KPHLGSGKTTFIQGLAKGLGIKNNIISPTFILIRTYDLKSRISKFYHIDLYRIDGEKEIDGLGIEELINNPSNIIAIEWAEKIKNILPKKRIDIYFKESSENERQITIERID
ncbi:tRNA (adenosine(37)-N6)-threonylcarbamoyltransferase complex ATPase subunit type 1 TsaE, partial [Patescibacteria group bacterium]|nr:tRNA (adenosine(37)-N6)-threonylcarbamoyltransferase complex ATPase subunit type 1 TsaE [Patescibacteria group bacterium]